METKNAIIRNFSRSITAVAVDIETTAGTLDANEDVNKATIKTLNVLLENMRSSVVLLQQEIDKYS